MARRKAPLAADDRPGITAMGGGLEGAEHTSRETALWTPSFRSPDQAINGVKEVADARTTDTVRNDGYAQGVVTISRDSIVGAWYRLNSQPALRVLQTASKSFDEKWAEEFQEVVEERFNLAAESDNAWFDASRNETLTGLIRMAIASHVLTGEVLSSVEWIREVDRPFSTALQMIAPSRLCNPNNSADTPTLRRGVVKNARGRALGYWIRQAHKSEGDNPDSQKWKYVPAAKPWGRQQIIHIREALLPDQTRGVSEMVSVLKHMRMTKTFQDVMLQNAVVNATYAAAIESELPGEVVAAAMGQGASTNPAEGFNSFIGAWMGGLMKYLEGSKNIAIDGVKMPHLYPGTKLNMRNAGTPGGVGTDFETSLLRHICAALNISYEEFSGDYSKTNYSSARAAMTNTYKTTQARKKFIADRFATAGFALWLEEDIAAGNIPLPRGVDREFFYLPMMKEAITQAQWVGAGRGQIDELKETQAALLRIRGGLSTREDEIARMGGDWRRTFRQLAREQTLAKELDLTFSEDAQKQGAGSTLADTGQDQPKGQNDQ